MAGEPVLTGVLTGVPTGVGPDLPEKLANLVGLARDLGVGTLVLREQASLSWLLGARSHVPQTLEGTCFDVVVDLPGDGGPHLTVVTNAIEAPRLRDTELAGLDAQWSVVPWWQGREAVLPTGPEVAADSPYADVTPTGALLVALRRRLTEHQAGLLRTLSADAAAATTAAAQRLSPSTTKYAAAGALADELLARGIDPIVLLVGGDGPTTAHRHPLPTTEPLGRRAVLVCCARRHGLVASVTRIAVFDEPSAQERDAYRRLLEVERVLLDGSRAGATIGEVVAAGTRAYGENGFASDEWHRHHQGGLSGWQPREYPAHPGSTDVLAPSTVVAWNPSAAGWKVEDTCIVGADGPQTLVDDGTWPTLEAGGRPRPDLLVLG